MIVIAKKFNFYKNHPCWMRDLLALTIVISLLFGVMLGTFPLEVPDGARYAEIPREMIASNDYLTPHLNGVKYFEKPPLFYWMQVAAMKTFGLGEWSVHSVNALMALLTCLLLYVAGRKIYNRETGIFASLILATSTLYFALARIITLDMTLTAFLSAALLSFIFGARASPGKERNLYMWAMYFFAALATMTKGLVGIIFPAVTIFFWIAIFREWRSLKTYCLFSGSILFLLIVAPWHILVQLKNPEFFRFYFFEQHFLRYFTSYAGREQGIWFLPTIFLVGFFPWIFFLPATIKEHWPRKWLIRKSVYMTDVFFLIWPAVIFIFYSLSDSKLATYILPVLPPLALLIGHHFSKIWQSQNKLKDFNIPFYSYAATALILALLFILAVHFIDFQRYAFTSLNLYLIAIALVISSSITYLCYYFYGVRVGLVALFITTMFFLCAAVPVINIGNNKSIKPLIIHLQTKLREGDQVVSYRNYYQDLPYYLRREIIVVKFAGELAFGAEHTANRRLFLDRKTFWRVWNSSNNMFLVTDIGNYQEIKKNVKRNKLYLVGSYLQKRLLLANHPV